MQPDDLQTQIDDIKATLDEMSDDDSDFQDQYGSDQSDQDDINNDIESRMEDVEANSGQLSFPLSQDTIDLITEQTPTMLTYLYNNSYIGLATLAAGTKTLTIPIITANSIVMLSRSVAGGTLGHLSYTVSAGSLVINSSSNTDTSTIIYFILVA